MTFVKGHYRSYEIDEHLIESRAISQMFRIRVFRPTGGADDSDRLPVLYATDGDLFFDGLASIAHVMQLLGEVPRFILVGIGYENHRAAELLRWRDLVTHEVRANFTAELGGLLESDVVADIDNLEIITRTTDARQFLLFICEELMPFITPRYLTRPGENSYYGYSAGGAFGLYTLFTKPDTFKRYILGSPATSYNTHHFGNELVGGFLKSGGTMDTRVHLSVGELEEFKQGHEHLNLVIGYYRLVKFLKQLAIPGLELVTQVFPNETHATAWMLSFSHGLKQIFGSGETRGHGIEE
jgi:uncharacterized protein